MNGLGFIYMNARYYVPTLNRFASADTIVPDPSNPQSFNRYSYTINNPLKYTDPSGHCFTPVTALICIGVFGMVALTGDTAQPPPIDHAANTASLNVTAYAAVYQRNDYYGWVQTTLAANGSN
ncbi:MAG: hypothetical protein H6665_03365, partial [Ardenticatenaceae bacterium]|nr:hypothetical protein [Ardenticatenaceae bacterium]